MEGQYSDKVMEHFRNPRNVGDMPDADGIGHVGNAICGDIMELYIKVKENVIVDAKFKTFGCLPKKEEIVSAEGGWDYISDVQKGSFVVNSNGESAYIIETFVRNYQGQLINIIPFVAPYNSFLLTPQHPVLCIQRDWLNKTRRSSYKCNWLRVNKEELIKKKPDYVEAKNVKKSDYLVFVVNKEVKDNPKFTKEIMRLLGYYLSEGHIIANGNAVAFALNKKETRVAEDLNTLIMRATGKTAGARIRGNVNEVYVCSKKLADFLKTSAGSGAKCKSLSKEIMMLPPEKQKELIKTYLVGDGSFYRRRPDNNFVYRVSTVSRSLAVQIQEILARNGVFASISKIYKPAHRIEGRNIKPSHAYLVRFQFDKQHNFVHRAKDYFLVPVRKVEKIPFKGRVYNFQVASEPNSYLVKGFAVHNCGAAIATSSMVTELVKGKTVDEALKISNRAVAEALGGLPPVKMHCSLLAEQALKSAIDDYFKKHPKK